MGLPHSSQKTSSCLLFHGEVGNPKTTERVSPANHSPPIHCWHGEFPQPPPPPPQHISYTTSSDDNLLSEGREWKERWMEEYNFHHPPSAQCPNGWGKGKGETIQRQSQYLHRIVAEQSRQIHSIIRVNAPCFFPLSPARRRR